MITFNDALSGCVSHFPYPTSVMRYSHNKSCAHQIPSQTFVSRQAQTKSVRATSAHLPALAPFNHALTASHLTPRPIILSLLLPSNSLLAIPRYSRLHPQVLGQDDG